MGKAAEDPEETKTFSEMEVAGLLGEELTGRDWV
jgi:hypothetical protein